MTKTLWVDVVPSGTGTNYSGMQAGSVLAFSEFARFPAGLQAPLAFMLIPCG